MVVTRRQARTNDNEGSSGTSKAVKTEEKRPRSVSNDEQHEKAVKKAKSSPDDEQKSSHTEASHNRKAPKAKCPENQPLINALENLVESVSDAQSADPKLRFQARNLRKVISTLSKFENKISSGKALTSGDEKVQGLGPKTGEFIDEFLEKGKISAIDYYHDLLHEYQDDDDRNHIVLINRAPVLTLWATVVYEKQGYTHEEALTHAKWISAITARAKGKSLGKVKDTDSTGDGPSYKKEEYPKVNAFGHMKVPVQSDKPGKRFAVMEKSSLVPEDIDQYLQNAFGGELDRTRDVLGRLADAIPDKEDLRSKAYDLYEKLRPEWQGWAQPGKFDLDHVEELIKVEQEKKNY